MRRIATNAISDYLFSTYKFICFRKFTWTTKAVFALPLLRSLRSYFALLSKIYIHLAAITKLISCIQYKIVCGYLIKYTIYIIWYNHLIFYLGSIKPFYTLILMFERVEHSCAILYSFIGIVFFAIGILNDLDQIWPGLQIFTYFNKSLL